MKQSIFRRYLIVVLTLLVTVQLSIFNSVYARSPRAQSTGVQTEYAPEELELVRTKMLELVDASKEMAGLLPDNYGLEELERARIQIEQFSSKELTMFRRGLDRSQIDWNRIAKARQTLIDYKAAELASQKTKQKAKGDFSVTSQGFPSSSPVCQRVTTEAMIATNALYLAAVLAKDIARDTCNQVIVALGEEATQAWRVYHLIPFSTSTRAFITPFAFVRTNSSTPLLIRATHVSTISILISKTVLRTTIRTRPTSLLMPTPMPPTSPQTLTATSQQLLRTTTLIRPLSPPLFRMRLLLSVTVRVPLKTRYGI